MNKPPLTFFQQIAEAVTVLSPEPEDIYIIKSMSSAFHSIYYCKQPQDLKEALTTLITAENVGKKAERFDFMIQLAKPHYGNCVKTYYTVGTSTFNYQESLRLDYFDKTSGPKFGKVDRKTLAYNQTNLDLDRKFPFRKIEKFMDFVSGKMDLLSFGIDFVFEEKSGNVWIIDLNSFPGYEVIRKPQVKNCFLR